MCGQKGRNNRVQVSGAMQLSRDSHRKTDPAIPNQVWARSSGQPTCMNPRKLKWFPLPYSPWSAPPSSGARTMIPNPPYHVHQQLRYPVHVPHRAPPPTVRRSAACVVVAKPRHHSVPGAWSEALRCYAAAAAVAAAPAREREGRGGGFLAVGDARKNSRCGGMRGRSRSRRTSAAKFCCPLESAQALMMSWRVRCCCWPPSSWSLSSSCSPSRSRCRSRRRRARCPSARVSWRCSDQ